MCCRVAIVALWKRSINNNSFLMYYREEEMYFMMHVEQIVRFEQTDILTSDWAMITKA